MTEEQKLEYYLARDYNIIVARKGGSFVFCIRELNLLHTDSSLADGHAAILKKKDAWIRELCANGHYDWIVLPGEGVDASLPEPEGLARKLLPFFIKLTATTLVLLVLGAFVSNALRDFGYNMEKKLDKVVAMTPQDVEFHQKKAHAIADRLRPIMLEVLSMFRPEAQANATATPEQKP